MNRRERTELALLKYFVDTIGSLLAAALLTGLIRGFATAAYGKRGSRVTGAGVLLGIAVSGVMGYMKNATRKVDTSLWNMRVFFVALGALLLFFVFAALAKKLKAPGEYIASGFLGLMIAGALFYPLPDILAQPYTILMTEKTILSTGFIYKVTGVLFGILLGWLASLAIRNAMQRLTKGQAFVVLTLGLLLNGVRQAAVCLRVMLTKRMITSTHTLFEISKFFSNHDSMFLWGAMLIALLAPILLLWRSLRANEPYRNPAEHRKLRRKWQISRRWSGFAAFSLLLAAFTFTVLKPITTRAVELSPVEDADVVDGAVYVPFEKVEDGHLHRFGYVTENGTQIRFIVIKKPNSSSYGIGLDACDICGETGYYEKDGQVVCKLCDVVMNIQTIGFKGGCNPIVIDYHIENGNIIVPVEGLVAYEKEFKK